MKKIEAIISAGRLDEVTEALGAGGIDAMTVSQVNVYDGQPGHVETYRGVRYQIDFHPRVKVELAVADEEVGTAVDVLERAGHTDRDGEEVILVLGVDDFTKIDAARGATALLRAAHAAASVLARSPIAIAV